MYRVFIDDCTRSSVYSTCLIVWYRAKIGYRIMGFYPGIAVLVAVAKELVWATELGDPVYWVGPGTT